jgi:cytochrome c-type biogenesis protein CcmH
VRRVLALVLALALFAPAASATAATQPVQRTTLGDVEDEVMCVVCGTPLNVADSPQADQERAFIRTLIDQGDTKKQVKDRLVAQFGKGILDVPSGHGFDLAAYLVPALALVLAACVVSVAVVRWRRSKPATLVATGGTGPSSEDSALLRDDLDRYDL